MRRSMALQPGSKPAAESGWGGSNPACISLTRQPARITFWALEKFSSSTMFGLAVSPDGRVIVYDRLLREGHDLMLIENFR